MRLLLTCSALLFALPGCHESAASNRGASRATVAPSKPALVVARVGTNPGQVGRGTPLSAQAGHELAAFAAGCFWGVEDAFRRVPGVTATAVGYTGGHTADPTYERVCEHGTGHAETVLVEFDPKRVSYARLLDIFFEIHDPTTLNRQGPDYGDQYRSAIFTHSAAQEPAARAALLRAQNKQSDKIVTQIAPLRPFYRAEDYHQQYAERTGSHGCPIRQFSSQGSASL
jgi:peptide-methionine (S)-S-oxide reductase